MPEIPVMKYDAVCHSLPLEDIEQIGTDSKFMALLEAGYGIESYMVGSISGSPHMFFIMVRSQKRSNMLRMTIPCIAISFSITAIANALAYYYL